MGLFVGDSEPSKIFVGDTPISKVFVGDTQVRPSGWQPGANTIAYYKLATDSKDYSGNGYDFTYESGITYTTLDGVNCAKSSGGSAYLQSSSAVLPSGSDSRTVAIWYAETVNTGGFHYIVCWGEAASGKTFALCTYNGKFRFSNNSSVSTSLTLTLNKWYLFVVTYSDNLKIYINGTKNTTSSATVDTTAVSSSYPFRLFNRNINTSYSSSGYLSEVIIEDRAWTDGEIADYYNLTKGKYGL